jgi:hypothetical protein
MKANLASSLRRRASTMQDYDRLPPELRAWLAQAALPWSVTSVRKLWAQAKRRYPSPDAALRHLTQVEQRALSRDAPQIWGKIHQSSSCEKYSRG